jgi:hypothetical protein
MRTLLVLDVHEQVALLSGKKRHASKLLDIALTPSVAEVLELVYDRIPEGIVHRDHRGFFVSSDEFAIQLTPDSKLIIEVYERISREDDSHRHTSADG